MTNRKSLKISEDTFDELKADKPSGVTWDYYLSRLKAQADG